ncbi:MAG: hypothetical protein WCQ21_15500 [Verrucomicrobiota bacterium]
MFIIKTANNCTRACLLAFLTLLLVAGAAWGQFPYTAAFTYQGRLTEAGNPVSGTYDMQFKLFDLPTLGTGTQQGSTIANSAVQVASGVFTVTLNFGTSVFDGTPRYIEVSERPGGSANPYNVLDPRQPVSPAPYAIYSLTAKTAASVANAAVVTSLNSLKDDVTLAAGSNVTITTSGNILTIGSAGVGGSGIWSVLNNNTYYTAGNVGIGTTGPLTPLEVSGALRSTRSNERAQYLQLDGGDPFSIRLTAQSVVSAEKSLVIQNLSGEATPGVNNSIQFAVGTTAAPSTKMTLTKDGNVLVNPAGGGTIQFGTPNFETGMTISGANRADIRFDDAKLKLVAGAGGGIPASENGIAIDLSGNVGIGTTSPTKKLQVQGTDVTETGIKSTSERAILSLESNLGGQNRVWTLESGLFGTPGLFGIYDRTAVAARLAITPDGNVGIGTATPQAKLEVVGSLKVTGVNNSVTTPVLNITGGADVAEPFPLSDQEIPKGSVVVIDDEHPGQLKLSIEPYDMRVAGIVSGANGINPGITLRQNGALEGDQNVALSGRVYVLADAANGPIKPGDLLTTSSLPGHAMKVTDHARAQGAILGKAMSMLKEGKGLVLVLVTLQ